jgi:hypothetical protein
MYSAPNTIPNLVIIAQFSKTTRTNHPCSSLPDRCGRWETVHIRSILLAHAPQLMAYETCYCCALLTNLQTMQMLMLQLSNKCNSPTQDILLIVHEVSCTLALALALQRSL